MISVNSTHGYMDLAYCNKYSLKKTLIYVWVTIALTEQSILSYFWGSMMCNHFQRLSKFTGANVC